MLLAQAFASETLASWVMLLALLALAPFVLAMVTSFVKIVVVTSMLRTALGTPQIPPTIVITGLAMLLTLHVMWPVGAQIAQNYGPHESAASIETQAERLRDAAYPPLRDFLHKHADAENEQLFRDLRTRLWAATSPGAAAPAPAVPGPGQDMIDLITVLTPAFILSELTAAFKIGLLIFIPFLVIDLVVSNLLMAVGMQYLQPTIVSLPLKLLLFVSVDGWRWILERVLLGYA